MAVEVTFSYDNTKPKHIRESVDAIVAQVAEQTKIVPLIGTPS